jgi:hypothetical protein
MSMRYDFEFRWQPRPALETKLASPGLLEARRPFMGCSVHLLSLTKELLTILSRCDFMDAQTRELDERSKSAIDPREAQLVALPRARLRSAGCGRHCGLGVAAVTKSLVSRNKHSDAL